MLAFANHNAKRNWRTNLAFLIAGKDLYDWRSKHNRIVAKMAEGATEARIIKLLEKEAKGFNFIRNFYAEAITSELIDKIKGGQK